MKIAYQKKNYSHIKLKSLREEVTLCFQNLCKNLTLEKKKKNICCRKNVEIEPKKQILFNASGFVQPGEMMAIMGPSGSGKTTLLNILARRDIDGVTGTVYVNKKPMLKSFKRKVGYVLQDDIFFENLTVREQLTFAGLIKLSGEKSPKLSRVEELIVNFGLEKCANTKISTISGGEKKRLNIATELLASPSLIYLDEPTSGLESTSAFSLIQSLKELANSEYQKKTIIASIHQPSHRIFGCFDKIMLLMNGYTVYNGTPKDVNEYFANLDYHCPEQYNIADFLLDLISDDTIQNKLTANFSPPKESKMNFDDTSMNVETNDTKRKFSTTFFEQFIVLLQRDRKNALNRILTKVNVYKSVGLAIMTGLCYWRMPWQEKHAFDRSSFLFFILLFWPMDALFWAMMAWPKEKTVILKERASGMYRLSAYYWSKAVAGAPVIVLLPCVFVTISYPMTGLNPKFSVFLGMLGTQIITCLASESIGIFISTIVLDHKTAMTVSILAMMTMFFLGGFLARNIPPSIAWMKYTSIVFHPFQIGVGLEFNGRQVPCDGSGMLIGCQGKNEVSGEYVARALGVEVSIGISVMAIIVIGVTFRMLSYLNLRFLAINSSTK